MNPIILLHGALGASTQLEPLKKMLQETGKTVYCMNFSGHAGKTLNAHFGIEAFAEELGEFIQTNYLHQVDIFGYSMGGYVAVWYAWHHPKNVSKIVTLGTKFDWSVESAEKEVRKLNPDKIEEKIPAFARILEKRHHDWKALLNKTAEMMLALGNNPILTEQNLKSIVPNVRICLGDQDDMADRDFSKLVSTWIPKGSFSLLENTLHPIEKVNLELIVQELLKEQH